MRMRAEKVGEKARRVEEGVAGQVEGSGGGKGAMGGDGGASRTRERGAQGWAAPDSPPAPRVGLVEAERQGGGERGARRGGAVSADEIYELGQTRALYQSSLVRLQMERLVSEARGEEGEAGSAGGQGPFARCVHHLKATLEGVPRGAFALKKATPGEYAYLCRVFAEAEGGGWSARSVEAGPPAAVDVVGSFLLQTAVLPAPGVDLAVTLPDGLLQRADVRGLGFFAKRAAYLVALRAHLAGAGFLVGYEAWKGCERTPVLVVRSNEGTGGEHGKTRWAGPWTVRVVTACPAAVFPLNKLRPGRNNLPLAHAEEARGAREGDEEGQDAGGGAGTPHVNNGVLEEMHRLEHLKQLHAAGKLAPEFAAACCLLRIWARRRGMHAREDGFSGFMLSMFLAHLLETRKCTPGMSRYQMFRVAMTHLAKPLAREKAAEGAAGAHDGGPKGAGVNPLSRGVFMKPWKGHSGAEAVHKCSVSKNAAENAFWSPDAFRDAFQVVFVDGSRACNLAARVSLGARDEVVREARHTLEALDAADASLGFDAVFIRDVPPEEQYDQYIKVRVDAARRAGAGGDLEWRRALEREVEGVLLKALGARAAAVRVFPAALPRAWDPSAEGGGGKRAARGDNGEALTLLVGIAVSRDGSAERVAQLGPTADLEAEAAAFRAFWGEKAELRRFADGRICEAVVWERPEGERHLIVGDICAHILALHVPGVRSVATMAGQLDAQVSPEERGGEALGRATDFRRFKAARAALAELTHVLRNLKGLPLNFSSLEPLAPELLGASPLAPVPLAEVRNACAAPLACVLRLESSGRWPQDLAAIQATKSAFLLAIADDLRMGCGLAAHTIVCAGHGGVTRPGLGYTGGPGLDVVHSGFVFRLHLHVPLERDLLVRSKQRVLAHAFDATMQHGPLHAALVAKVAHTHASFGPTVRLAQRWVSAHLFDRLIPREAVDLLAAVAFVHPVGHAPPGSHLAGFTRFLQTLTRFDPAASGDHAFAVVLDVGHDLDEAARAAVRARCEDLSKTNAAAAAKGANDARDAKDAKDAKGAEPAALPALLLATSYDPEGGAWTGASGRGRPVPTLATLRRLAVYARSSLAFLGGLVRGEDVEETAESSAWAPAFNTPLDDFELRVHLRREALPAWALKDPDGGGDSTMYRLAKGLRDEIKAGSPNVLLSLLTGFDPVSSYVADLEARYPGLAPFLYDRWGGSAVVARLPSALLDAPVPLRLPAAHVARPVDPDAPGPPAATLLNLDALLTEVALLGQGLVAKVEVVRPGAGAGEAHAATPKAKRKAADDRAETPKRERKARRGHAEDEG